MRLQFNIVSISRLLFTACLLALGWMNFRFAATWRTRSLFKENIPNFLASMAFATLALVFIGLIVLWTDYQKRTRSSWFIMAVFVFCYFMPVNLIDVFLDIRRVGWSWWPAVVHDAREGHPFSIGAIYALAFFAVMLIALLLPVRAFFGKQIRTVQQGSNQVPN